MKATIEENGNLQLTPESHLENYALCKWYDGYTQNGEESLSILRFSEKNSKNCMNEIDVKRPDKRSFAELQDHHYRQVTIKEI